MTGGQCRYVSSVDPLTLTLWGPGELWAQQSPQPQQPQPDWSGFFFDENGRQWAKNSEWHSRDLNQTIYPWVKSHREVCRRSHCVWKCMSNACSIDTHPAVSRKMEISLYRFFYKAFRVQKIWQIFFFRQQKKCRKLLQVFLKASLGLKITRHTGASEPTAAFSWLLWGAECILLVLQRCFDTYSKHFRFLQCNIWIYWQNESQNAFGLNKEPSAWLE